MITNSQRKSLISQFYNLLISQSPENSYGRLTAWRDDLSLHLSVEDWQTACALAHTRSINIRLQLIQFKWLMRTYVTPADLSKYNKNVPDVCTKCLQCRGTLIHCVWYCREIALFWREIRDIIEKIISKKIMLDPKLFLFGLYPGNNKYLKNEQIFIDLSITIAKKCISLFWKRTFRPTAVHWMQQMLSTLPLEKITYTLRGKQEIFESIWNPFIVYAKDQSVTIYSMDD